MGGSESGRLGACGGCDSCGLVVSGGNRGSCGVSGLISLDGLKSCEAKIASRDCSVLTGCLSTLPAVALLSFSTTSGGLAGSRSLNNYKKEKKWILSRDRESKRK